MFYSGLEGKRAKLNMTLSFDMYNFKGNAEGQQYNDASYLHPVRPTFEIFIFSSMFAPIDVLNNYFLNVFNYRNK